MATVGAWLALACTQPEPPAHRVQQSVLTRERSQYFDYAFVPARSLAEWRALRTDLDEQGTQARWLQELLELGSVSHAAGTLAGAALDPSGAPLSLPERPEIPLRYTCGATLISPSYALTAAHCVADDVGPVTLTMYRPTPRLAETVPESSVLSGEWPNLVHPALTEADGYFVDTFECQTVLRCDERWGPTRSCPHGTLPYDVALVQCAGHPGARYGYLDVFAELPVIGSEVFMTWTHELYDAERSSIAPEQLDDHYIARTELDRNLHYQGADQNILLPLRSTPWPDGTPRRLGDEGWTDMMGCHGTSGSGLLALAANGYRIFGIATSGSEDLQSVLCHDSSARAAEGQGPGDGFIGSNWAEPGVLADAVREARTQDCSGAFAEPISRRMPGSFFDGAAFRPASFFSQLGCQPLTSSRPALGAPLVGEPAGELGIELPEAQTLRVGPFAVAAGDDYRASVQVVASTPCTDDCARFDLALGTNPLGSFALGAGGERGSVGLALRPSDSGSLELVVSNQGVAVTFGAITLIREGQANTFDTPFERLEASLLGLTPNGSTARAPMRFTGDGEAGFDALLRGGERMLLARQALLAGQRFTVRLEASTFEGLSCGFADISGEPVATTPCAAVFSLEAAAVKPPAAFFVEAAGTLDRVTISAVALASSAARDGDADDVPDVLDACPSFATADPLALDCTADVDAGHADAGVRSPPRDAGWGSAPADASVGLEPTEPTALPDAALLGPDGGVGGAAPTATPPDADEPAGGQAPLDASATAPASADSDSPMGTNGSSDAGSGPPIASGDGCGCRVERKQGSPLSPLGSVFALAWLWRARRRRASN